MYRLALLTLVASVSAYVTLDFKCPEFTSADNFNFEAYSDGVWHVVAMYHDDVEKSGKCGYVTHKTEGDIKKIQYNYVKNNKLMTIEGKTKPSTDAGTTGKLTQSFPYGANGTFVDYNLDILAVDYDNFFVAYYCQFDEATKTYIENAWVASRSTTLSEESRAAIDKFVKESKFLNADKFTWPSLSKEECSFDA